MLVFNSAHFIVHEMAWKKKISFFPPSFFFFDEASFDLLIKNT